jgi:peptidoglycan/LPS O-acetylase OafA/YrhL
LPPYYGALLLSIVVSLTVTTHLADQMPFAMYLPLTTENVVAHVFLVHNFRPDWMYKINGVMWSIAIEAQLYVVFPYLVRAFERVGRWPTWLASLGLAGLVLRFVPDAMKLYPWFVPLFILGMVAAWAAYRPNIGSGVHPEWGWAIAGGCLGLTVWACLSPTDLVLRDLPMGAMVAAFCYAGAVSDGGGLARAFGWRPLVALGGFSYSLYLVHHPLQQVLFTIRPAGIIDEVGIFFYLLAAFPLLLLGAWAFGRVFESPWRKQIVVAAPSEPLPAAPTRLPLRPYRPTTPEPDSALQ